MVAALAVISGFAARSPTKRSYSTITIVSSRPKKTTSERFTSSLSRDA